VEIPDTAVLETTNPDAQNPGAWIHFQNLWNAELALKFLSPHLEI
jgi:hypothetical protein